MENNDLENLKPEERPSNEEDVALENDDIMPSKEESEKVLEEIEKEKQPSKKSKKNKKPKKLYSLIIISIVTGICCGGVGLVGGYMIYNEFLKPEATYDTGVSSGLNTLEKRAEGSTDLLKTFEEDPYNLVNYSMIKFARKRTSLIISANVAKNMSGNQNVTAATINTPNRTFNENISSTEEGAMLEINTAFRFYDNHNEIVNAYEYKVPSDWKQPNVQTTHDYTYDEYMDAYGKLNQGLYVVDDENKYLRSDTTVGEDGNWISAVSIFQITKKSVKDFTVTPLEDGKTEIALTLYSNRACYYSSSQVKTNAGASKKPTFSETVTAAFVLDENFDLYSSTSSEEYEIVIGIPVMVNTVSTIRYFASDTDELIVNGTKVEIPEIDEDFPIKINPKGEFI